MRRTSLIVGACLVLVAGGVALGHYVDPHGTARGSATTTTVRTTTTVPTTTTTTVASSGALPAGRYNYAPLDGTTPYDVWLDVADDGPGGAVTVTVSEAGADGSQSTIVAMPGTAVAGTLSLTTPDYDCPDTPCPISASYGTGATADGETVSGVSIYFGAVNYGCALWLNLTTLPAESCNFAQAKG